MTMMANRSPFSIPYTHVLGDKITVDFSDAMKLAGFQPTPGRYDQRHFTGGYLYFINDTDFSMYGTYDTSGHMCILVPGLAHFCPLNADDQTITFQIIGKNPSQVHPQELLHVQYLDEGDIKSGHAVIAAASLNPSFAAASIGAGALPDSVAIGTDPSLAPVASPAPNNDERVGVELFSAGILGDSGVYGGRAAAVLSTAQSSCVLKLNNYFDGTNDRFIRATQVAVQFLLKTSDNTIHVRRDDGTNQVAGGIITWAADYYSLSPTGVLTLALTGSVNTPRVNYQGTLSASNKIQDLQQGYQYFSDNTATFGTTRNWLDGPDRGEMQIGPRAGANYFDWIRLRATHVTLDLGRNTSTNAILFEVTGGPTQLDNNTIHSDGAGNLTAVSFTGNVAPSNITAGALTEGVTIGADDITAENLAAGVKQQNGSTILGINSAGGGAAGTQTWVGTTDPAGSAAEGDVWIPV